MHTYQLRYRIPSRSQRFGYAFFGDRHSFSSKSRSWSSCQYRNGSRFHGRFFRPFRQTELAIYAVMSVSSKVWALLLNSSHNKEVRKDWKESDGLECFEKVV